MVDRGNRRRLANNSAERENFFSSLALLVLRALTATMGCGASSNAASTLHSVTPDPPAANAPVSASAALPSKPEGSEVVGRRLNQRRQASITEEDQEQMRTATLIAEQSPVIHDDRRSEIEEASSSSDGQLAIPEEPAAEASPYEPPPPPMEEASPPEADAPSPAAADE